MTGLSAQEIAAYWATEEARLKGRLKAAGRTPSEEPWSRAMSLLLVGDGESLVVFRQLLEASPSDEGTALLLTGYLDVLPWADDPEFVSWLRHMELTRPEVADTLREIRKYELNHALPSKPKPALKRKGERWKKSESPPE